MKNKVLALLVVPSVLFSPTPAHAAITPEDGTCDLTLGNGTSSTPWLISNISELREIIDCDEDSENGANGDIFKLTGDIDASSLTSPITDSKTDLSTNTYFPFQGTLDGDDGSGGKHSITGINLTDTNNQGLFYRISGTVKNLTVSGTITSTSGSNGANFGGLAAWMDTGGLVQNVTSDVDVLALDTVNDDGAIEVGGIIGTMTGGTVENSLGLGKVQGKSAVGGIVGRAYGTVAISNVTKRGEPLRVWEDFGFANAGGIIGSGGSSVTLTNVTSRESITSHDNVYGRYVGGLAGRFSGVIDGGEVDSATSIYGGLGTGGAVGFLEGGSISEVRVQSTVDVVNTTTTTGGLVGLASGSFQIDKSYSLADVRGYNSSVNGPQENVGGLVGATTSTGFGVTISNSFAAGEIIDGASGTGGLIGDLDGVVTIADSFAALPINSSALATGGLVGRVQSGSSLTVTTSYWDTDVTTESSTAESAGTGLKTSQFLDPDNLFGFDFSTVWGYNSAVSSSYPWLRWTNDTAGYWQSELGFTVTFDRNGGTGGTLPDNVTLATSSSYTVPTSDVGITKGTTTFSGWALSSSATTADTTLTINSDKTLYAVWTGDTTAPAFSSAALDVDGKTLTVVFSETMGAISSPTGFAVLIDGVSVTSSTGNIAAAGTQVAITLTDAVTSSVAITLNYTAGSVADVAGNSLASFSGQTVSNNSQYSPSVTGTPSVPYTGPSVSGLKETKVFRSNETATFVGERLGDVSAASIGSLPAEIIESLATEFSIRVPTGLTPGTYDLVIESSLGNLTYLDAITIDGSQSTNSVGYGEVSAWTKRISDTQVKVYVKYPTVGEKVRISHQVGGSGSYETVYVKTTSSETMDGLRIVEGVGTYVVRTIDLEQINRIRVTVGDEELAQVRYGR